MHANALTQIKRIFENASEQVPLSKRNDEPRKEAEIAKEHIRARNADAMNEDENMRPYSGATLPRACLYGVNCPNEANKWLQQLRTRQQWDKESKQYVSEAPNEEQYAFLNALVQRVLLEAEEEQANTKKATQKNPCLIAYTDYPAQVRVESLHGHVNSSKRC